MQERDLEILSAFVDGEAVDTAHLVEMLEQPVGHAALLDFLRLRETLERDPRRPSPALVTVLDDRFARPLPWWWRPAPLPMAIPAAMAAFAAVVFSFWLWWKPPLPPEGTPQAATPAERTAASEPPVPNRVLYFEAGVDWHPE